MRLGRSLERNESALWAVPSSTSNSTWVVLFARRFTLGFRIKELEKAEFEDVERTLRAIEVLS